MALNTQTFGQTVRNMVAAVQGAATSFLDFTVGSVALAILEAYAAVVMWLQGLIVYTLSVTRAATSQGTDLDSWMADYGLTRLPAVAATGSVTFGRITTTNAATIPVGSLVETADGSQQFAVIADTTQIAYSATQNAYLIPAGIASISATVQNVLDGTPTEGADGNVVAGAINTLSSAIPYVDTVTNATAFSNGVNAETDAAFRIRFQAYLQGLREGIPAAVEAAIADLQQGIQYDLVENQTLAGVDQPGYFYVVINPYSSSLQAQVSAAIDAVRPTCSTFGVFQATQLVADVAASISALPGFTLASVQTAVQDAITAFIGTLGLGMPLYYTQLYAIAYGVAGVQEVTNLTVNNGTADLAPTSQQIVVAGTVAIA